MKNASRWALAFLAVALVSFLGGVAYEHGAVTTARDAQAACTTKFEAAVHAAARDQAILDLYRASADLGKSNFGNATEFLGKARGALTEAKEPKLLPEIDAALDASKKNDKSAVDHTLTAIGMAESH